MCPLLNAPKPQVLVHGLASDDPMFYEMIITESYRPKNENTRMALITVVGGDMSIPQIVRQLQRVVPVEGYQWEVLRTGQNVYKVQFPSKAELDRLKVFGSFKVPNTMIELTVDDWLARPEPMNGLPRVWVRVRGIPSRHKGDFLAL